MSALQVDRSRKAVRAIHTCHEPTGPTGRMCFGAAQVRVLIMDRAFPMCRRHAAGAVRVWDDALAGFEEGES